MEVWVLSRMVKRNPPTGGRNTETDVSLALPLMARKEERLVLRADYGYYQGPGNTCAGLGSDSCQTSTVPTQVARPNVVVTLVEE